MNLILPMLPKEDTPNLNGVTFSCDSLKNAVAKYKADAVQKGRAPVYSKFPSPEQPDEQLTDVLGIVQDIQYNEDDCQYYVNLNIIDTPLGNVIRAGLEHDSRLLGSMYIATNKIGVLDSGSSVCNDEPLSIRSVTLVHTSDKKIEGINNLYAETIE